ncbi:MAG: alpha/beta hydrolase [Deltaproteobacteria bacterium]
MTEPSRSAGILAVVPFSTCTDAFTALSGRSPATMRASASHIGALVAIALALPCAGAQVSTVRPDFTGVWVMDTTKFAKNDPVLVSLTLTVTAQRPASGALISCSAGGAAARCGTLDVYEDRAARAGRKIALNIVVVPAVNASHARDPVFWLDGGPGAGATRASRGVAYGFFARLNANHDLVFVDQRGTGKSNPLDCDVGDDPANPDLFFGKLLPVSLVKACREKLESLADLRMYTTPIAMDDLDDVRAALGYDKIDIAAASYGTIAAQVYMRQHPDHVRAVFLTGIATPGIKQPLLFARGAQAALDSLYVDCAADDACHAAFPRLKAEFNAALARFDHGPVEMSLVDSATGRRRTVTLERESYVERLRLMLYTTNSARFVPLIVHRAFAGDFAPFAAYATRSNPGLGLARGMYFTVTCSEGVAFITESEVAQQSRGTFVGEARVRAHQRACAEWPRGDVPRGFTDYVKSSIPVLMFSGAVDGSTPPWFGAGAVRELRNGRQVIVRYAGHQTDSPCAWGLIEQFIRTASVAKLDVSCTRNIRRPPFATELPH